MSEALWLIYIKLLIISLQEVRPHLLKLGDLADSPHRSSKKTKDLYFVFSGRTNSRTAVTAAAPCRMCEHHLGATYTLG